jgi:hypothetical protein
VTAHQRVDLDVALTDLRARLRQLRTQEPERASYRRWARFLHEQIGFHVAANTVRAYELGEHEIPARYVLAVALATRRDPFWLMRDEPAGGWLPETRDRRAVVVGDALQAIADRLRSGELPLETLAPAPVRGQASAPAVEPGDQCVLPLPLQGEAVEFAAGRDTGGGA